MENAKSKKEQGALTIQANVIGNTLSRIHENLAKIKDKLDKTYNNHSEIKDNTTDEKPTLEPLTLHEKMLINSESANLIERKILYLMDRMKEAI
jgi:hypothetical protein